MFHSSFRWSARVAALAGLVLVATGPGAALAGSSTTFSGQATVISGQVAGQTVSIVNAGPIPAGGGAAHNCLLAYPTSPDCQLQTVPDKTNGAVAVEVLGARAVGQGSHSHASASAATVSVDLGTLAGGLPGPTLKASFLDAEANAVCQTGVATASGTSQILDVTLDGVSVDPALGKVNVGPVTILFNQVSTGPNGTGGQQADVTTLEIIGPLATDLVIGHAHADITCGSTGSSQAGCSDKITGGGWYDWLPTTDNKVHFTLAASAGDPTWGHLLYDDKQAGLKFHGSPDFAYLVGPGSSGIPATWYSDQLNVPVGQGAAIVSGTNAQPFSVYGVSYPVGAARFIVAAIDNGEGNNAPGDVLGIAILNASDGKTLYSSNAEASGGTLTKLDGFTLGGGNIQYHDCR